MAAIYWRGDNRTGSWWLKTYHPLTKEPVRQSLETVEKCRAELICRRVELEVELRRPTVASQRIPEKLGVALGLDKMPECPTPADAQQAPEQAPSPDIKEVLGEFLAFIHIENSPGHEKNKIAYLRKFFGSRLLGLDGDVKGVFCGTTLADVKVAAVGKLIESLPVGRTTKRHHREAFHALFEFAMKYGYFTAVNFRYPNPMSALPTWHEKNRRIVFLKKAEADHLLEVLSPNPSVQIAVAIMIFAGLRRAEALWLTKSSVDPSLRFLSIVNKMDEEKDLESSLKTGERAVQISPSLKALLEPYLSGLASDWIVPSPTGLQWHGDNFGCKHRTLLKNHNLTHTCLHYRHTYATDRAREGWSLFKIAKSMGNSVAVCEQYYAAYVDPAQE